ncbi:MAG: tRNA pseudouridine(55) synthase TruB [Fibromonadales bacterium]|nr:tRNA pseudouridine(55) synthase TruB [Fibromonadales bacterium]
MFILIDKPPGITSFKALHGIKKKFNTKRAGHAGTLDLAASGLIIAAIGKCTRLLPYMEAQDKTYSFDLRLGISTDTLEPTGNILKEDKNSARTPEQIDSALQAFIGEIEQVPPAFSAIKINGKRSSDLALKGLEAELKPRKIVIHELRRISGTSIYCKCSKGTYIRSLARDIAEKLGTCGVAGCIRRLAIGGISVEQASEKLIPPQELFNWQIASVSDEEAKKILNGVVVASGQWLVASGGNPVFIANNEQIIAVAEIKNGYILPKFLL